MEAKKVVLVITDGIGYNESSAWNAFYHAKKPNYDFLFANAPYSMISTFGTDIGLPENQMGNSEVGHMCIGSGRVLYQDLVKIQMALDDGSLAKNKTLLDFANSVENIHLCGLVSDGGVHSHINHLLGLINILSSLNKKIFIHAITDGRDIPPFSAPNFIKQILNIENKSVKLASICGRFYAMDRDNRWERIKKAYDCLMHAENRQDSPLEYLQNQFKQNISDEFIEPASFGDFGGIKKDDGFLFFNFRSDRAREIIRALGDVEFGHFERDFVLKNILTMCEYDKTFNYPILFPKDDVRETLADIIAQNGLSQAHIAETEKYAHVTFFFNGGREEPVRNENRILIPSPKVKTYDLKPEMSAREVCDAVLESMENEVDFIIVNFANGDMVGHTGSYEAAIKAVEAVDSELGRIIKKSSQKNYALLITSDHGNCEKMKDEAGNILTNHTAGFVWLFAYNCQISALKNGKLDNIAPSVLKLMNLPKPTIMSEPLF